MLSPHLASIIKNFAKKIDNLEVAYDQATSHINEVSINALGYLPKRFESNKKLIVISDKAQDNVHRLKDFEFDRI
jgi:ABC-type Zn uptake system ZnuABC Zn-binding protein ZnuA